MLDKLQSAMVAPAYEDIEKTRVSKLLNHLILTFIALLIFSAPIIIFTTPHFRSLFVTGFIILMGVSVSCLFLLRSGYVQASSRLLLMSLWLVDTVLIISTGQIDGSVISAYVVLVMISSLILEERETFAIAGLTLITGFGIYGLVDSGLLIGAGLPNQQVVSLTLLVTTIVYALTVLILAVRDIRNTVARLRKNEQVLAERNLELQSARSTLEAQVAERTYAVELSRSEAEATNRALQAEVWRIAGLAELANAMRGIQDVPELARNVTQMLCRYLDAQVGAFYIKENSQLTLVASYAYSHRRRPQYAVELGQGLVGQAALEKQAITLTKVPEGYMDIVSGLGHTAPREIIATPILFESRGIGVVEIGTVAPFTQAQLSFIEAASENIGIAVNTTQTRARIDELLMETKQQAEELQVREGELRSANEELARQTETLRFSENSLRENQTQLQIANKELQSKATALEESSKILLDQKSMLDRRNQELIAAQEELKVRAEELARASQYKSEFLANISHELRTPLNSMLILARMLADNDTRNLNDEQVESAGVIYKSGKDLLNLINEILDLSKVEAGRVEYNITTVNIAELLESVRMQFIPVASDKNLSFEINMDPNVPQLFHTDELRVQQILKNLLSNAFKFTEKGYVHLDIYPEEAATGDFLAFAISDTGIGMTPEQEEIVFEAFRQADGSTSRRYGGTGLGLAISLQMAQDMGGNIILESELGQGSIFTLTLPLTINSSPSVESLYQDKLHVNKKLHHKGTSQLPPLNDSRILSSSADTQDNKLLIIIEDDPVFSKILGGFAREKGFSCLIASDGETGLKLTAQYHPIAVLLDLNLPGMSGWDVLDKLKLNPATKDIPIHMISAQDKKLDAFLRGAIGFLTKPAEREELNKIFEKIEGFISKTIKNLLIIEDNSSARYSIRKLLDGSDVIISEAANGSAALQMLQKQNFDCIILDINLPDMSGFDVLKAMNTRNTISRCPVIVYTGQALTEEENYELMKYADSVIIKGVKSPDRLLDETARFLHNVISEKHESEKQVEISPPNQAIDLPDKNVLIVDDDMRGAFALSKLLGDKGLTVTLAHSGYQALQIIDTSPQLNLILMDIMMPDMDGYETIRLIREREMFKNIPILAVTAKAMKGDAEKCIAAGANDYLSKPIDVDRLLSMIRVLLNQ